MDRVLSAEDDAARCALFVDDVLHRLCGSPPNAASVVHSAREGYALLDEAIGEYRQLAYNRVTQDRQAMRDRLLRVAVLAVRVWVDLHDPREAVGIPAGDRVPRPDTATVGRLLDVRPAGVRLHPIRLNLDSSIANALGRHGFVYLEQVADYTDADLLHIKGISRVRLARIRQAVAVMQAAGPEGWVP